MVRAEEGAVLLDGDKGIYWQMNSTGSFIFKTLIETGSAQEVVNELRASFPGVSADHENDVKVLVEKVESAGLVKYEP